MKKRIYGALVLLLGVASIVAAWTTTSDLRAKGTWPSVLGKVVDRRLEPGRRAWRREPRVTYEYVINNQTYKNDQVFMMQGADGDEAEMRRLIDSEIPEWATVYYDPADPSRSYLIATSKLWFYVLFAAGILMLPIGLILIVGAGEE